MVIDRDGTRERMMFKRMGKTKGREAERGWKKGEGEKENDFWK